MEEKILIKKACTVFDFSVSTCKKCQKFLKISLYEANANGRSPNIVLEGFTLKVAELQVGKPFFRLQKT